MIFKIGTPALQVLLVSDLLLDYPDHLYIFTLLIYNLNFRTL